MKNFYIITKNALTGPTPNEFTYADYHWIDLGNGSAVVVAKFKDEGAEMRFSSHPAVSPMPHILSSSTIDNNTFQALKNLFPAVQATHKTFDVANEIGKIHPMFRPTVF